MHEPVIIIAKYFIIISILATLVLWLRLGRRQKLHFIGLLVLGGAITLLLAKIGSHLFYNPRPFVVGHFTPYFSHGNDNGFPSDHTLLAGFLAFACWPYGRRTSIGLIAVALLIGLSRVVAGVHHLIDIIGSLVFALIGAWLANLIVQYLVQCKPQRTPVKK